MLEHNTGLGDTSWIDWIMTALFSMIGLTWKSTQKRMEALETIGKNVVTSDVLKEHINKDELIQTRIFEALGQIKDS